MQGQTTLDGSQLTVNSDVTIDGGTGVTIDADQASRVLLVQGSDRRDNAAPDHHRRPDDGRRRRAAAAASVRHYTTLTLDHATVSGNSTEGDFAGGGGIGGFDVTLTNSTVSGNSTRATAPRAAGSAANVTLTDSTVSGNSTAGDRAYGGG